MRKIECILGLVVIGAGVWLNLADILRTAWLAAVIGVPIALILGLNLDAHLRRR